jgi:2'-5' RNA ligase
MYKYLPRISHFVFSKEAKGDDADDAVQRELALLYYTVDKHNWEINQFLQQLLYYSPYIRTREEIKKRAAELQVNDPGQIPRPASVNHARYQLTLFVNESTAGTIEFIRRNYNPLQAGLIAAHVTLCREKELVNLKDIERNLSLLYLPPVTVQFGAPKRFADDKGLLLPGIGPNTEYHDLRKKLLKTTTEGHHSAEPHITLIHPRNGTCTDAIYQEVTKMQFPASITFDECCLIKQEGNEAWKILKQFPLVK